MKEIINLIMNFLERTKLELKWAEMVLAEKKKQ
jgi:hypothetical protein